MVENMAGRILNTLGHALKRFEQNLIQLIFRDGFPPAALCAADLGPVDRAQSTVSKKSVEDILKDAILWGVPKKRRTIEKRLKRRFGIPEYHWKPLVPRTDLLMCHGCGGSYEAGHLCGHCYERVKLETKEIQDAIFKKLDLSPVESEVIVLYEGEKSKKPDDFWKNQRIVELEKKRPEWFDENLLQPTTQGESNSTDVKPEDLA